MKRLHIMGVSGSGASAVAEIAKFQGFSVTGCDSNPQNDSIYSGHSPDHLQDIDILAYTPAILSLDPNNTEIQKAHELNLEVLTWQEFMGKYLEKDRFVIAVCGTKGKTTVTAMTGLLLEDGDFDPTVELGAKVSKWNKNYRVGKSKYFLTEADEFNNNFLVSHPEVTIITNVVFDHPEFFPDFDEYKEAFFNFLCQTKNLIIANLSDPNVAEICKQVMKQTGIKVIDYSKSDFKLNLKVPGDFNRLNANAVFHLGLILQIPVEVIKKSLENFTNVSRRFEKVGDYNGAEIYSDYAHNPLSLEVTMKAMKEKFPDKKLWIFFQPHMFSRTKALFDEFVDVFKKSPVDGIAILDIYPSREIDTGLVTSQELVKAIDEDNIEYTTKEEVVRNLKKYATNKDVFFFMGAGDIDRIAREIVEKNMKYLDQAKSLYQNKKVLILGLGINQGGLGVTKFFARAGAEVKVTDLKSEVELKNSLDALKQFSGITYSLGEHKFEDIDWADIVLRNPGVKPDNKFLLYAREKNKQVEMDLGIFLQFISPKQIIGVTGTKGKSTTASLIYDVLKTQKNVVLAGNIGKSIFDLLEVVDENSWIILELSSFQLQSLEVHEISPHISVITNIYEDHLNYHGTMEEYIQAKRAITAYQSKDDFLFISSTDKVTSSPEFKKDLKAKIIYFSSSDILADFKPTLPGEHNRVNMAAALKVVELLGVDTATALEQMKKFTGVEFRLQLIKDKDGIKIYNDSAATNPSATIEAIKSLPNSILIAGGVNKDLSYIELAEIIDEKIKAVFFLEGDATEELRGLIKDSNKIMGTYNNLPDLVKDVLEFAKVGDTILFSPAAASFNLFQNEFDRGRVFNQVINPFN